MLMKIVSKIIGEISKSIQKEKKPTKGLECNTLNEKIQVKTEILHYNLPGAKNTN